jgi:hypothetical protein
LNPANAEATPVNWYEGGPRRQGREFYTSKEGAERPSKGAPKNPPKAQLPKTRRRTEQFNSMYTQAEHRIPARATQVREQKNPKFPEISAFKTLKTNSNSKFNKGTII